MRASSGVTFRRKVFPLGIAKLRSGPPSSDAVSPPQHGSQTRWVLKSSPSCSNEPFHRQVQLAWLLMRAPAALDPAEQALVTYLQQHPVVCQAQGLAQTFTTVMREQALDRFERWLETCLKPAPSRNCKSLRRISTRMEQVVVRQSVNHGVPSQCEGQITRLKYLKRAMYGRASFALLRHRVLYREATFTKVA